MTQVFSGTDGAQAVAAGTVGATQVVDGSITGTKLASATVTPSNLSQPLTLGTAVTASGTAIDFTGIPSWVKRITVMLSGVSTNGTSFPQIQLGTSGGVQTSGYASAVSAVTSSVSTLANTTGFALVASMAGTVDIHGSVIFTNLNAGTGLWVCSGVMATTDSARTELTSGSKTLSGTLDRIRLTTVNGTDTFDAGTVNIMYE